MVRNESIKIVWDEGGTCHAIRGRTVADDDRFIIIQLIDGTELSVAKSNIIKIERSPERIR
jgi:hypothetical protein